MSKKKRRSKASQSTSVQPAISSNSAKQPQHTSATAGSSHAASAPSSQGKPPQQGARKASTIPKPVNRPQAPSNVPLHNKETKSVKFASLAPNSKTHNEPQVVQCAENIVLLGMLPPTPCRLARLPVSAFSNSSSHIRQRTISLSLEKQLACALAFVSARSYDPDCITAVCIQELPPAGSCNIMLAINKRTPDAGSPYLDKVHEGFTNIFVRLGQISSTLSKSSLLAIEDTIFKDIVALCQDRILARLGIRTPEANPKTIKTFIASALDVFLEAIKRNRGKTSQTGVPLDVVDRHTPQIEQLRSSLYAFKSLDKPKHQDVTGLIRRIAQFMKCVPLEALLRSVDDLDMHAHAKKRLLGCLKKTARYLEISRFFCQQTRKVPVLRHATVEKVRLPDQAFERSANAGFVRSVEFALERIRQSNDNFDLHSLPPQVQKATSAPSLFEKKVKQSLTASKIHAEIQILAHYEKAAPNVVLPRVIASSKKPCFLCESLIHLHGKFWTPAGHKTLYPGWYLPAGPGFVALRKRLNEYLEQRIAMNISELYKALPATGMPNESSIYSLDISTSTLHDPSQLAGSDSASCTASGYGLRLTASHNTARSLVVDSSVNAPASVKYNVYNQSSVQLTRDTLQVDAGKLVDQIEHNCHEMESSALEKGVATLDFAYIDKGTQTHASQETSPKVQDHNTKNGRQVNLVRTPGTSNVQNPEESTNPPLFELVMGRRDWFRSADLDIFVDTSGLSFCPRWLNAREAAPILQRHEACLVDIQSTSAKKAAICTCKDVNGNPCLAFGSRVVVLETHINST